MAKILIVDDEPSILELFRFVFEDAGYDVTLAKNGRLALDAVRSAPPDFMVVDVAMPEMSGREFVEELKLDIGRSPRPVVIPFIVMTGENVMDLELNRAFATAPGFSGFLPKMTPPEQVLRKVSELLEG